MRPSYPDGLALNSPVFYLRRHRIPAAQYRLAREEAFDMWSQVTCIQKAA
jgi:hypothetical protein